MRVFFEMAFAQKILLLPALTSVMLLGLPVQAIMPVTPSLGKEILGNLAYHAGLGETTRRVKLSHGEAKMKYGFLKLEQVAWGDLNGDGQQDAAVQLVENGGGTGYFRSLQVVLNQQGKPVVLGIDEALGDRVIVKKFYIQNGLIVLDMIVQDDDDGACCPTRPVTWRFKLAGQKLVEQKP